MKTSPTPERLRQLLTRLDKVAVDKPLYAKMPIGLDWETFRELVDILREHGFSGVIIGNLNKDYASLDHPDEAPAEYRGGLSGKPCREPSTELIRKTRAYVGPDFTIIGCGGILSAEDALEKLDAGADLLQLISGMIFEGPHLMRDIARALADRRLAPAPGAALRSRRDIAPPKTARTTPQVGCGGAAGSAP